MYIGGKRYDSREGQIYDHGLRNGSAIGVEIEPVILACADSDAIGRYQETFSSRNRTDEQAGWDMNLAGGGLIRQSVFKEPQPWKWDTQRKRILNIQILNSVAFEAVTEQSQLPSPITSEIYRENGIPFFSYMEENALILSSKASAIKSVAAVDENARPEIDIWVRPDKPTICLICRRCFCTTMYVEFILFLLRCLNQANPALEN
jgi:hypothetical protein